eukprot:6458915-Amphidinium_carterae.1
MQILKRFASIKLCLLFLVLVTQRAGIAMVRKCSGVNAVRALPMRRLWRSVEVVDVEECAVRI